MVCTQGIYTKILVNFSHPNESNNILAKNGINDFIENWRDMKYDHRSYNNYYGYYQSLKLFYTLVHPRPIDSVVLSVDHIWDG